jgi:hypothetical protein
MATEHWQPFRINDENSPSGFRGIDIDIAIKLSYQDFHGPSVGYSLNSAYFKPFDSDSQIKIEKALR